MLAWRLTILVGGAATLVLLFYWISQHGGAAVF